MSMRLYTVGMNGRAVEVKASRLAVAVYRGLDKLIRRGERFPVGGSVVIVVNPKGAVPKKGNENAKTSG